MKLPSGLHTVLGKQDMNIFRTTLILALLVLVSACSSGPNLRSDFDPSADFSKYKTYGFVRVTGTDQAQYQTLVTQHFKRALREQGVGVAVDDGAHPRLLQDGAVGADRREVLL